jgi:hypothetical protein
MVRGWATLGLCLGLSSGLSSIALAESGVRRAPDGVPPNIPSDGVLPLIGSCVDSRCSNLTSAIIVHTASGTRVEGHFELIQTASYDGWAYFVPSVPFRSGAMYAVTLMGSYASTTSVVSVSEADPVGLDESALRVMASLNKVRAVSNMECCPISNPTRSPRCLDVAVVTSVELTAALSAERPIATQYVYELSMHPEGEAAGTPVLDFEPLRINAPGGPPSMWFSGSADSYCYVVRARPIVGGEPVTLVTRCIANDFTDLGRQVRSPEAIAQWRSTCPETPTPVDAGVLPRDQADASTDGDGEALGHGEDDTITRHDSGCQLAASATQAGSILCWPLALLILAKRKRTESQNRGRRCRLT